MSFTLAQTFVQQLNDTKRVRFYYSLGQNIEGLPYPVHPVNTADFEAMAARLSEIPFNQFMDILISVKQYLGSDCIIRGARPDDFLGLEPWIVFERHK